MIIIRLTISSKMVSILSTFKSLCKFFNAFWAFDIADSVSALKCAASSALTWVSRVRRVPPRASLCFSNSILRFRAVFAASVFDCETIKLRLV